MVAEFSHARSASHSSAAPLDGAPSSSAWQDASTPPAAASSSTSTIAGWLTSAIMYRVWAKPAVPGGSVPSSHWTGLPVRSWPRCHFPR